MEIRLGELPITEKQALRDFLARAITSYVYMTARDKANQAYRRLERIPFEEDAIFHINFDVEISGGMILAVIGDYRREKEST